MATPAASSITIRRSSDEEVSRLAGTGNHGAIALALVAEVQRVSRGSIAAQLLPGRVASVTPPQCIEGSGAADVARQLVVQLSLELRAEGVELAQALLSPRDVNSAKALREGGYEHASDLLYMAAEADSFPEQPVPLPFVLDPLAGSDESRLQPVVDATYAGTLDCPRIDGLRSTRDVLSGYRAVGDVGDRLWRIVRADGIDAGCLLLADHSSTQQYEIVYVGLVPAVRGRGWGLELTRHAQWLAREAGRTRLVLAVDAANEPAIRIYAAAGFRAWDRQAVWIQSFRAGPTVSGATT